MNKKIIVALVLLAVLLGIATFVSIIVKRQFDRPDTIVEVNGQLIKVEVAEEPFEKMIGLGGRKSLPEDKGMVFIYDRKGIQEFWMKGMTFPIDVIWLNDWKVVDISRNLPPQGGSADPNLKKYSPKTEVNAVLEINAGLADKWGIEEGMTAVFTRPPEDKK